MVSNADGTEPRQVTSGRLDVHPEVSPVGKAILFASAGHRHEHSASNASKLHGRVAGYSEITPIWHSNFRVADDPEVC